MAERPHTDYIPPVRPDTLHEHAGEGRIDPAWQALREQELHYIHNWRQQHSDQTASPYTGPDQVTGLIGLSLSGGGIRSATFSLGVMQALAAKDLLKRVDYLSTVSGGGYIGSSLTWLCSDKAQQPSICNDPDDPDREKQSRQPRSDELPQPGTGPENFAYGRDDPAPQATRKDFRWQTQLMHYLRQHGYYLTPGNGITALSLLSVILRGTFLNLLVWITAFILFFIFGLWGGQQLHQRGGPNWMSNTSLHQPADAPTPLLVSALQAIRPSAECPPEPAYPQSTSPHQCGNPEVQNAFDEVENRLPELLGFEIFLRISVVLLSLLLLGPIVYSVMTWFRRGASPRTACRWYRWRRLSEKVSAWLIPSAVATAIIGTLPLVGVYLHSWLLVLGPMVMVGGILMTIKHAFSTALSSKPVAVGPLVSIGAGLLLYGIFLTAYEIAFLGFDDKPWPLPVIAGLILLTLGLGWFVNLNYISIHRYYRDRLMESFLPDIARALKNLTGAANGADSTALHQLFDRDCPRSPFHIINTNLVLVDSDQPVYRHRGGDNFVLTPCYCGSNATGWRRTGDYMGGKMTLATAMAISAAAVNPNSGVGGEGLTRNRTLSLVMSLLNLRLGYWADNPDPDKDPRHSANHFRPGMYSFGNALGCSSLGFSEQRAFLNISDGGQFENMAIYELVRRRATLIMVCDGGGDLGFTFSDFQTTVQRIGSDFGARVQICSDASPDQMVPMQSPEASYPKDIGFAERGYMVGTIHYADGSSGTLLYMKTTLIDSASFRVKGYAAENRDFPDQSTADQFFDEVQFEAYRELGYRIATDMLEDPIPVSMEIEGSNAGDHIETLITRIRQGASA